MRSDLPEPAVSVSAAARWPAHRAPGKHDPDEYGNGDNNAKHNQRHGNLLGSHPLCALFTMLVTVAFKRTALRCGAQQVARVRSGPRGPALVHPYQFIYGWITAFRRIGRIDRRCLPLGMW
jgi:hypothetical protein